MPNPQVVDYIRRNRPRYIDQAIRSELLRQGFAEEEIAEAFAALRQPGESESWSDTFGHPGFWLTYLGVLGGSVFLVISGVVPAPMIGLVAVVVLVLLLAGTLAGSLEQPIRRACGCALATLVVTPIVVFAGLYAYCLLNQSSMTF